jgi:hypothetical protein
MSQHQMPTEEVPMDRITKSMPLLNRVFYQIKPLIPRSIQLSLRRRMVKIKREKYAHIWPIDASAAKPPSRWPGWPDGKEFAFILMHDVDTQAGHDKCLDLAKIEENLGFRSTFNFVPERYQLSKSLLTELKRKGFGIGVHGLKHDGKLFSSRQVFLERAKKINQYLKDWDTKGFTSPAMHRNLKWMSDLNIEYGTSTFDTDPFEPQPDGVQTIFPFWVPSDCNTKGYFELPYTLPQDFTIYILMQERNTAVWRKKLDWIAQCGGMALLNSHPDYMCFEGAMPGQEEYSVQFYTDFLMYLKKKYTQQYWHGLSKNVAVFLKNRSNLQV